MRRILIATLLSLTFFQAQANDKVSATPKNTFWKCQTDFKAKARGFTALGMGKYELVGRGVMSCQPISLTRPSVVDKKRQLIEVTSNEELEALNVHLETLANNPVEIKMPVKMTFVSSPFQIGATLGRVHVAGFSHSYTLTRSLNELIGEYKLAGASGSLGLGLGGFVAAKMGRKALALNLSLQVLRGFGGSFGFSRLHVSLEDAS